MNVTTNRNRPTPPQSIEDMSAADREEAAEVLVSAARVLFTERGYRQTGFDDLAEWAGLAPRLARELYPDKAAVFGALVERTVRVAGILGPVMAEGVDEDLPARLARTYLSLWEPSPEGESPLIELYRVALSDQEASLIARDRVSLMLNSQIDRRLPNPDAVLRTSLFGAQVGGTAFARHLMRIEPVASAPLDTVIEAIAPALRRTLLGSES
ncbi:TetR family transcriptional regulator [Streptacidiphilus sp. EB129]|uniref:TetR/AcrR family transcriptional regulator n=1 Tax=Streptacidiphilus sp. EB129 TaxID=3156262 RepID=UPI003511291A